MKIVIKDIAAFRAVLSFAAVADVRFYLNGLFIEPDKKRVSATNGHVAGFAEIVAESDVQKNQLFGITDRIIPKGTKHIVITDDTLICYATKSENPQFRIKIIPIEVIDHEYVNIERAVALKEPVKPINEIILNTDLLKLISKITKRYKAIKFKFANETERLELEFSDELSSVKAFIMPMRDHQL